MGCVGKNMTDSIVNAINHGKLCRLGIWDKEKAKLAIEFFNDFQKDKFEVVRLVFPDQHGVLRGKVVSANSFLSILSNGLGLPSTLLLKDTAQKTVFPVWSPDQDDIANKFFGASDLIGVPDLSSLAKISWSKGAIILLCDLYDSGGNEVSFSPRQVMKDAVKKLARNGYQMIVGLEVEFQIYEKLDGSLDHDQVSMPPQPISVKNLTQGWQFLSNTRYGDTEFILNEIKKACDYMNLGLCTVEIEMGPSQFEFTFLPSAPTTQADRFVLFRSLVKEICGKHNLHATFMSKPNFPHAAANGWHIHQSVVDIKSGKNVFTPSTGKTLTTLAGNWIAGLLQHAGPACLLTTPTVNGYKRFQPFQLAPNGVNWGFDNRGAMIRALIFEGDDSSRIENRVAESAANPYFALAAQIACGLDGILNKLSPPNLTTTPYEKTSNALPKSLIEAIDTFENSSMFRQFFGQLFVDYMVTLKSAEWQRYSMWVSDWEQTEYFNNY